MVAGGESQRRVLVVDDDGSIGTLVAALLKREGFLVDRASSSAEAVALDAEHRPDILVADAMLGSTSGVELARGLHAARPSLGVVLMSGYPDLGDIPFPLLAKPFSRADLLAAVDAALACAAS